MTPAPRIIVIGCVKGKRAERAPARELYTSQLFQKRRAYAEASGAPWGILSARWGVVDPAAELDPYEFTLADIDRRIADGFWPQWWQSKATFGLTQLPGVPLDVQPDSVRIAPVVVELHAGAPYVKRFRAALEWANMTDRVTVETPMEGKQIGEQLSWYKRHAAGELAELGAQLTLFGAADHV